jgi:hypothetical protein
MTYGGETWTLTALLVHKFKVAQRNMERAMLEVSLRDRIRNQVIWQRSKDTFFLSFHLFFFFPDTTRNVLNVIDIQLIVNEAKICYFLVHLQPV